MILDLSHLKFRHLSLTGSDMKHTSQSGIAIFIAVIVVSALLFIAVSISSLSYKEQIISASARDSRVAFFAADSGAECALFHDLKGGNDINNPFVFEIPNESQSGVIVCDPSVGAISTDISTGNPTVTPTEDIFSVPIK